MIMLHLFYLNACLTTKAYKWMGNKVRERERESLLEGGLSRIL